MTVAVFEDRAMTVQPGQVVKTAWVNIDICRLGSRVRMSPEAVEKKFRRLLCLGDNAAWPPVVGYWDADRFVVTDGRHEYLANLMYGRAQMFVAWLTGDVVEREHLGHRRTTVTDTDRTSTARGPEPEQVLAGMGSWDRGSFW